MKLPGWLDPRNWFKARRNQTLANPDETFIDAILGQISRAGLRVTQDSALSVATVFACVNLLARTTSTLPLKLFERTRVNGREGKREAFDHPLYDLIVHRPNMEMTPADFRGALAANLALRGNAFARIVRDRGNRPRELWPIHSSLVRVGRNAAGVLEYHIASFDGRPSARVPFFDILHIRGLSFTGAVGLPVLETARDAIGLAAVLDENASRFFANSSRPGLLITSEMPLTEPQVAAMKKQIEDSYQGTENAYRTMILGAMKAANFSSMRSDNEASQFDQTRSRQGVEICKLFGVPPHKVGILDHATFSNIEHQQIQFAQDTMIPLCVQWEQAMMGALLTPAERGRFFLRHNVNGLMRGDAASRSNFYSRGILDGWLTRNEVRALEDMDAIDGLDVPLRPLNMGDGTQAPNADASVFSPQPGSGGKPQSRMNGTPSHEETETILTA